DLEARRPLLPDAENSGVRVLAAKRLVVANWPAWESVALTGEAEHERQALEASFSELEPQIELTPQQVKALREELPKMAAALAEARPLAQMPRGRYIVQWAPDYVSTMLTHV